MKKSVKLVVALLMLVCALGIFLTPGKAYAEGLPGSEVVTALENSGMDSASAKAWSAGIAIAVAAGLGAIAMGIVIAKTVEGIARQPEAEGKMRTVMMLGLVFVETAIIYALIVAILIIFVL